MEKITSGTSSANEGIEQEPSYYSDLNNKQWVREILFSAFNAYLSISEKIL
jgi:hypothetical protein